MTIFFASCSEKPKFRISEALLYLVYLYTFYLFTYFFIFFFIVVEWTFNFRTSNWSDEYTDRAAAYLSCFARQI
jgi:hypothetical protein